MNDAQPQLRIDVRREPDRVILGLDGELDMANASHLQAALAQAHQSTAAMIVLDLRQLSFIDSTGLRVLLAARKEAQERGQEFAVTPGSQQVQRLLAVTRVSDHLRTIETPGDALV
jgi:anti-sigma B factor antagonist